MIKPVKLSDGTSFDQVSIAQAYYRDILRSEPSGTSLSPADENALLILYRDYCEVTSWPIISEILGVRRGTETRFWKGKPITTDCFIVVFTDGSESSFSFEKACSAIASYSRALSAS